MVPLGGADCAVLRSGEQVMLIDMGKTSDAELIRNTLRELGISHIDIAFNTHPHPDHVGGMKLLLHDFPVGVFVTCFPLDYKGIRSETVNQIDTVQALNAAGIPIRTSGDGDVFRVGNAECTVMQQAENNPNTNQASAMMMIRCGDCSILLTADVVGISLVRLTDRYDLKADILKYPHHGIEHAAPAFIEEVSPEYAYIPGAPRGTDRGQLTLYWFGIPYNFACDGLISCISNGHYWLVEQKPLSWKYWTEP